MEPIEAEVNVIDALTDNEQLVLLGLAGFPSSITGEEPWLALALHFLENLGLATREVKGDGVKWGVTRRGLEVAKEIYNGQPV